MCHMFLAVHWLLAKSRVENLGTVDGSADDARTQFSLQPKLSALDVGLMERLRVNGAVTKSLPLPLPQASGLPKIHRRPRRPGRAEHQGRGV